MQPPKESENHTQLTKCNFLCNFGFYRFYVNKILEMLRLGFSNFISVWLNIFSCEFFGRQQKKIKNEVKQIFKEKKTPTL